MESSTHIINIATTTMPVMNPTLAVVYLKVATNKWADWTEFKALLKTVKTILYHPGYMKLTCSTKCNIIEHNNFLLWKLRKCKQLKLQVTDFLRNGRLENSNPVKITGRYNQQCHRPTTTPTGPQQPSLKKATCFKCSTTTTATTACNATTNCTNAAITTKYACNTSSNSIHFVTSKTRMRPSSSKRSS